MDDRNIEQQADEAFSAFRKTWPYGDAGDPTGIEMWHHAWRASIDAERARQQSDLMKASRQLGEWAEAMGKTVDERDRLRAVLRLIADDLCDNSYTRAARAALGPNVEANRPKTATGNP